MRDNRNWIAPKIQYMIALSYTITEIFETIQAYCIEMVKEKKVLLSPRVKMA
jgi:hypothetical protein